MEGRILFHGWGGRYRPELDLALAQEQIINVTVFSNVR
jgi:hypothetical protein